MIKRVNGFTEEDIKNSKDELLSSYEFYTKEGTASALRFWINRANQYFYLQHQKLNNDMKELRKKGDYTDKKLAEIRYEKEKAIENEAIAMREKLHLEVLSYLAKKQASADKMLTQVPTEQQSIMLDMVEKNKHISNEELSVISQSFKTNYVAIKTLQGILKDRDIILTLPKAYDYNEILKSIEFTPKYLDSIIYQIGLPRDKQTLPSHAFLWNREENAELWIDNIFEERIANVLDINLQMLEKIELVSIDKLDEAQKGKLFDVMNESDSNKIAQKIKTLENEKEDFPWNDAVLNVLSMHPDFAPYVSDENKAQENQE